MLLRVSGRDSSHPPGVGAGVAALEGAGRAEVMLLPPFQGLIPPSPWPSAVAAGRPAGREREGWPSPLQRVPGPLPSPGHIWQPHYLCAGMRGEWARFREQTSLGAGSPSFSHNRVELS